MDVTNLSEGMKVKNYKIMCELLNESVKTGNAKKYQLKEWNNNFIYVKEGHSFIIKEIFENKKIKLDGKEYNKLIQLNILNLVLNNIECGLDHVSKTDMLYKLKMVNDNYKLCRNNPKDTALLLQVNESIAIEFFGTTQSNLTTQLENAFKSLKNKALINYNSIISIVWDVKTEFCDEETIWESEVTYADIEDLKIITLAENTVLSMLGYPSKKDVFLKGNYKRYMLNINSLLVHMYSKIKEDRVFKYYYNSYQIATATEESIIKNIIQLSTELDIKLNESVIKKLNSNAYNRKINSMTLKDIEKQVMRMNESYLSENKKLINNTIDIKAKKLTINDFKKLDKEKAKQMIKHKEIINTNEWESLFN